MTRARKALLDANPDTPPQLTTPSTPAASTASVHQRPAPSASSSVDTPAPPTYSQVVSDTPPTVQSNVGAAGSQMEVAILPENRDSELSPQSENKTAFEMLINNLKKKLPNINSTQARYLVSLLQDLRDDQHIPAQELHNPQLENILIQEISNQTQVPLITVVKDFIREKLTKH